MRLWTREQAQAIDERTIREGFSSLSSLVNSAGVGLSKEIRKIVEPQQSLVFLIGPGLNGADGWTAAAELLREHPVSVFYFEKNPSEIWLACRKKFESLSQASSLAKPEPINLLSNEQIRKILRSEILVDCLFGTGLDRNFSSEWISWIQSIDALPNLKIAADLPSGLDANTGEVHGAVIRSEWTFTFGAPKPGLFIKIGPEAAGKVRTVKMPFPEKIVKQEATSVFTYSAKRMKTLLPDVQVDAHKYKNGQVHIVAGSSKYRGAALLTARGALRSGAGFVHLHLNREVFPEEMDFPEILFHSWSENNLKTPADEKVKQQAWVVGPGLDTEEFALQNLNWLAQNKIERVVVDATALRALPKWKGQCGGNWILTPHAGEAAELLGCSAPEVENDRLAAALSLNKKFGCTAILKGPQTLIAHHGRITINRTGNAGLAKAGSGDVLAGLIGSFLTKMEPVPAAHFAVWLHGHLADRWLKSGKDILALSPSDLIEMLPMVLLKIRKEKA